LKVESSRSPCVNELSPNNNANLLQYLNNVSTVSSRVLVVGDFNLPSIDWKNQITSLSNQSFEHHFLQKLQDTYLCQHVQEPTRFRDDSNPSVLDLVITKSPDDVRNIEILPPLGKSDHTVLKLSLKSSGDDPTPQKQTLKYNYTKGDYESFRNFILSLCITEQLRENKYNVNEVFELIHEALVVGQNKFIPIIAYSK